MSEDTVVISKEALNKLLADAARRAVGRSSSKSVLFSRSSSSIRSSSSSSGAGTGKGSGSKRRRLQRGKRPSKRARLSSESESDSDHVAEKVTAYLTEKQIVKEMWNEKHDRPFRLASVPAESYYTTKRSSVHFRGKVQRKIHGRIRAGVGRFLKPGFTIRFQSKTALRQLFDYVNSKFPDANFSDDHIRELLIPKLNRAKTNAKKKSKASKKDVEVSMAILSNVASVLHKKVVYTSFSVPFVNTVWIDSRVNLFCIGCNGRPLGTTWTP